MDSGRGRGKDKRVDGWTGRGSREGIRKRGREGKREGRKGEKGRGGEDGKSSPHGYF